ncbi:hypothetical protein BDF19DRAFT_445496 [Syncephalis fuscata]|nr:hypothetical protein BDF19DRAFT_445496 [Syncephalis fuscata]
MSKLQFSNDLKNQTIALPNTKRDGQTAIYRNSSNLGALTRTDDTGFTTCYDNIVISSKLFPNSPCLGHRPYDHQKHEYGPYVWESYTQIAERVEKAGAGLEHFYNSLGVYNTPNTLPNQQYTLGFYAVNRREWTLTELAGYRQRLVTVALYDTLGPETIEFILNHAEVQVLALSADKILNILQLREKLPQLKGLICMDSLDTFSELTPAPTATGAPFPGSMPVPGHVLRAWAAEKGLKLIDYAELEAFGHEHPAAARNPVSDDIATYCYTSGTTGNPKGAILTHLNIISAVAGVQNALTPRPNDVHICYLPLAHVYERVTLTSMLHTGVAVGFSRGDTALLMDDIAVLRPTVFITVPRLLNRIYDKLTAATVNAEGLVGIMARRAVASKLERLANGQGVTHPVWDRLLFNKIRQIMGGRVRLILSGSAPIGKDVLQFLRIAFCCEVHEGYGQTENAAAATITLPGEYIPGHVGVPVFCCELKLVDIPEMNYFSTDKPYPRGEVCLRGNNTFVAYLKDPEKTRETIDEDKWLHTGDVGQINANGSLSIIDRKKNIFKLSQGEYVAPEKIENVYVTHPAVAQVFVHGDSLQSQLVTIIVPDPETFPQWVTDVLGRNISIKDLAIVCEEDRVLRDKLLNELNRLGRKAGLHGFEQAKNIRLSLEPFSIENNLLTPTLKLKRMESRDYYRTVIDEMYAELTSGADFTNVQAKL